MAKKTSYRVRNWSDYNRSLIKRGSLTFWFAEDAIPNWYMTEQTGQRGRPATYGDIAIECMLTLKAVYHLPLRSTQGLVESIIEKLELPIEAPNYTTVCRRQQELKVVLQKYRGDEPLHAVFDSTGLKVYGDGEWKVRQHGTSKRRTWRKLHLGVDEESEEIIATVLTTNDYSDGEILPMLVEQIDNPIEQGSADGAYDCFKNYEVLEARGAKVTIPPRENAKIRQHGNCKASPLGRDENIREIRRVGRTAWKKQSGYHRRSLAETAIYRFKRIFGGDLEAVIFHSQAVEAFIKCNVLNKMTDLGMPDSYAVI